MSEPLQAALRYAARGWPVFPCRANGKTPCTRNGLKDATTDHGLIGAWWATWSTANVAVRTGADSGIVVLDVDGDDGAQSLRDLELEYGELPRTASVVTPRGGQHYYFRHPGSEVPNSAGKLGTGLDIRGDGGYVLAPPSVGANGRHYEPDERCGLALTPPWLLGRIAARRVEGRRAPAGEWLSIVRNGVLEGQRNEALSRLTGHLLRHRVQVDVVAEVVHLVNAHRSGRRWRAMRSSGSSTR